MQPAKHDSNRCQMLSALSEMFCFEVSTDAITVLLYTNILLYSHDQSFCPLARALTCPVSPPLHGTFAPFRHLQWPTWTQFHIV